MDPGTRPMWHDPADDWHQPSGKTEAVLRLLYPRVEPREYRDEPVPEPLGVRMYPNPVRLPCDAPPLPNVRYPRVEFSECDPDVAPFQPSWQTAVPAVDATLRGWLERLDEGPFAEVVVDENGRRWQLSAHADEGELHWRVEMAGYQWFLSATAGRPPTA